MDLFSIVLIAVAINFVNITVYRNIKKRRVRKPSYVAISIKDYRDAINTIRDKNCEGINMSNLNSSERFLNKE